MAGLSGRRILDAIGDRTAHAVIRAMPNTPCRLGLGVTGIALSEGAAPATTGWRCTCSLPSGAPMRVPEGMLDAVTATERIGTRVSLPAGGGLGAQEPVTSASIRQPLASCAQTIVGARTNA